MKKSIAIIGTMDTKGAEVAFVAERVLARGHRAVVIDVGPLSGPGVKADYPNTEVARLAGYKLADLVKSGKRDKIMTAMGEGAKKVLLDLFEHGRLDGVLGLGGNQGSAISSLAMKGLPLGLPKFLVSTVASGNIRPYVGYSDIAVTFSVSDLVGGPNLVSRSVLSNAISAVIGMAEQGDPIRGTDGKKTIALSALGNTEPSANRIALALRDRGFEVVSFHASGAGGSAMEDLLERGVFGGVIDLTTHELAEEITGCGSYVPVKPGRLTAAGKAGVPQVVSLGGLEYFCGGTRDSIPPAFRKRRIYMHNPLNANVKLSRSEMAAVGALMAERLNKAKGPVEILVPLKGWSVYGSKGGPLYDPLGNAALLGELRNKLRKKIRIREIEAHINDEKFSEECVGTLLCLLETRSGGEK